jgi:O-antigen/teichoic acid export membrane protein
MASGSQPLHPRSPGCSLNPEDVFPPSHDGLSPTAARPEIRNDRPPAPSGHRLARAIGGSFLLAVATLPFGYLTSLILARVGPDAVGIYSFLSIYLAMVSGVLYLGGGTVTIRFVTELARDRQRPFFFSYLAVSLSVCAGVLALVELFPAMTSFVFGSDVSPRLVSLLLLAAPVPLLYFSALATLRGLMLLTFAQALTRSLTVGAFLVYGSLFLLHRELFRQEYVSVILVPYFLLLAAAGTFAFARIRLEAPRSSLSLWWFLPPGFWRFALAIQASSVLALMQQSIDQILVLRTLGLSQLGVYFLILQLTEASRLLNYFLSESVFPAVSKLHAENLLERLRALHSAAARYMLALASTITLPLIALSRPLLEFLGEDYASAHASFVLLLLFVSLDSLGLLNHTFIVGLKKTGSWTAVQLLRFVAFVVLFHILAPGLGLLGVVLARGIAWGLAGTLAIAVTLYRLPIRLPIPRQYFLQLGLSAALGALVQLAPGVSSDWTWGVLLSAAALLAFFTLGGYRLSEVRQLSNLWRADSRTGIGKAGYWK